MALIQMSQRLMRARCVCVCVCMLKSVCDVSEIEGCEV